MNKMLPQKKENIIKNKQILKKIDTLSSSILENALNQRVSAITKNFSNSDTISNYLSMVTKIEETRMQTTKKLFLDIIKKIDDDFYTSEYRKSNYKVHSLRKRTLITTFGEITITRRYYIHNATKERLFYVDKHLGLNKYDVYDPVIKSLIREYSATHNFSQISKSITDICSHSLFGKQCTKIVIPRQTIKNIIDSAPIINVIDKPAIKTPKELHILLDEKWIPLQGKSRTEKHKKEEVKCAVVYENATNVNHSRMTLNNVHYITSIHGVDSLRTRIMDYITEVYDLDKIEHIYVMGDGANWIQVTPRELTFNTQTNIEYLMDWFHIVQGINRITKNKFYSKRLFYHLYCNKKDKFIRVLETLAKAHPDEKKRIDDNKNYILNNWKNISNRLNKLNKTCSMESHISHGLAAHFTEVPKAYSVDSLEKRVNIRELFLNKYNLRELFLKAYDYVEDEITFGDNKTFGTYEDNILEDEYYSYQSDTSKVYSKIISAIGNATIKDIITT